MTAEQPFDLEAAAASTRGEAWAFTYGGRTFAIAGDLSLEVLDAYARFAELQLDEGDDADERGLRAAAAMGPILAALAGLFDSDEDYAAFRALRPGQAELVALLGEVTRRATGAPVGEPSPSSGASDDGSPNTRPISAVTTG